MAAKKKNKRTGLQTQVMKLPQIEENPNTLHP
jgi:hypothetical protein